MAKPLKELVFGQNKGIDFEEGKTFRYEYAYDVENQLGAIEKRKAVVTRSLSPFRYGNRKVTSVETLFDGNGNYIKEDVVEADRSYTEEKEALERVLKKFNKWEGVHKVDKERKYTSIDRDLFRAQYIQNEDIRKKLVDVFNQRFIRYARGKFLDLIAEGLNSRVRRMPGESDESFRVRLKYSVISHGDPTTAGIESFIYNFFGHNLGKDLKEIFVTDEKHVIAEGKANTSKNYIYVDNELVRTVLNPFSERIIFGGVHFTGDGQNKIFELNTEKTPIKAYANFGSGLREVIVIDKNTVFEKSADLDEVRYDEINHVIEFEKAPVIASDIYIEFKRSLGNKVRILTNQPEEYLIDDKGNIQFNDIDNGKVVFLDYVYITNDAEFIARVFEPFTQILKLRNFNTRLRASTANKYNLNSKDFVESKIVDREKTVFDYTGDKLYENIVYKTVNVPDFGNNGFLRGEKYGRSVVEIILKLWQRTTINTFKEVDIDNKKILIEIEEGGNDAAFIVTGSYEVSISDPISGELILAREGKKLGSEDYYELISGQNYITLYNSVQDIEDVRISKLDDKENYIELGNAFVDKGRRRYVLTRRPERNTGVSIRVLSRSQAERLRGEENYVSVSDTDWEFVRQQNYVKFHRPLPLAVERIEITYSVKDPYNPGRIITRIDDLSSEGTIFTQSGKISNANYVIQQTGVYRISQQEPGVIYFNDVDISKQVRVSFKHTKNIDLSSKAQEMMEYLNEIKAAGVELFLTFFQGWTDEVNIKERFRDDILFYTTSVKNELYYLVSDKKRYIGNVEKEPLVFPIAEQFITVVLPAGNFGYVKLPDQEFVIPNSIQIAYTDGRGRLYRVDEIKPVKRYTVDLEHGQEFAIFPEEIESSFKMMIKDWTGKRVDVGEYEVYANDPESRTIKFSGSNVRAELIKKVTRNLFKNESESSASFVLSNSEMDFNLNEIYEIEIYRKQARTFKLGILEKLSDHIVVTSPEFEFGELVTISDGKNQWQTTTTGDWGIPTAKINNDNFATGTTPFDYTEIDELFASKGLMIPEKINAEIAVNIDTNTVVFDNRNLLLKPWDYEFRFYKKTGRYTFEFYNNEFAVDYSKGMIFFDEADVAKHIIINYLHSNNRPYFALGRLPKFDTVESVKMNEVVLAERTDYTYSLINIEGDSIPTVFVHIQIPKESVIKVSYLDNNEERRTDEFISNIQMRKVFENLSEVAVDFDLHDKLQTDYYNTTPNDFILMHRKDQPYRGMRPGIWHETKGALTPGSGNALGVNSSMPMIIKHAAKTFYIDRERIRHELNDKVLAGKREQLEDVGGKFRELTDGLNKVPGNLRRAKLDVKYNKNNIEIWQLWPKSVDFVNPAYYGFLNVEEEYVYGFQLEEGKDFVYDELMNEIVFLKNLMHETEFIIAYTFNDVNFLFTEEVFVQRFVINNGLRNRLELKIQFPGQPAEDVELEYNPQTGKFEGFIEKNDIYPFRFKATDISGNIEEFNYVLKPAEINESNDPFSVPHSPQGFENRIYAYVNGFPVDAEYLGNGKFQVLFEHAVISSGDERYNLVDILLVDKAENKYSMTKLFIKSEGAYLGATFAYSQLGLVKMYTGIDPTKLYLQTTLQQWKIFHEIMHIIHGEIRTVEEMLIRKYNEPGTVDMLSCRGFKPLYKGMADDFYPYYGYGNYGYGYGVHWTYGYSLPVDNFVYGYPYYDNSMIETAGYYSLTNDYVTEAALGRYKMKTERYWVEEEIYVYNGKAQTTKNFFLGEGAVQMKREIAFDSIKAVVVPGNSQIIIVDEFTEGVMTQMKFDKYGNIEFKSEDGINAIHIEYEYVFERVDENDVLTINCGLCVEDTEMISSPTENSLIMVIDYSDNSQEIKQLIV